VKLPQRQQFQPFLVVIAEVVQRLGDAVHRRGLLRLDRQDRHAVDEEHDVQPDVRRRAIAEGELVGNAELVGVHVHRVEQLHVALALLGIHEHGLEALEELPGVQVALDSGPHAD
jgi:hypothetical protein